MRKISTLALAILIVPPVLICQRTENSPSVKIELIDGIRHVTNSGEPAMGKISLEVTEALRIDARKVDPENPPVFRTAVKDDKENLYLADNQNVRVYKFDSGGRLIAQFLGKGQGPGEFSGLGDLQIIGDQIWVIGTWPLKIARFTLDGKYIDEWTSRKFQNFYLRTRVIGEDRFLTVGYRDVTEGQDRPRVSALINKNEELLTQYYEDKNAGIFRIRTGQQGPAIVSTNLLVAHDIHHARERSSGIVFVCNNMEYEIHSKNPDGTTLMVIHAAHKKLALDEPAKEKILQLIAPRIPPEARRQSMERLPDSLNVIWGMEIIPSGHLAVWRITGLESVELDLFDREGRLQYTILPSKEIPDLRDVIFYEQTIGVISELEDNVLYREYRVKNLKALFD
jgi:6-bladed beta-propeller